MINDFIVGFVTVSDTGACAPLSNQAIAWPKNLSFLDIGGGPDCLSLIIVMGVVAAVANLHRERGQDPLIWPEWKIKTHLKGQSVIVA